MGSPFPTNAKEYIQWVFSPHIGVFCDEDSESSCLRNNLKFVDLIQPFCQLPDEVGISDPNRTLITLQNLRLVLQDINVKPPAPAVAKKILSHVVSVNATPPSEEASFSDLSCPWYEKWRETFHQLQHPFDHEFTKHLLACIFVVSSSHGSNASEEVQKLTQQQHQQQHQPHQHGASKFPKWFSPNILKYYLVLHDVSTTTKEIGDAAYQSVNALCGNSGCHILSINSGRPPDCSNLPAFWTPHTLIHTSLPGNNSVTGSECSSSPASPCDDYSLGSPSSVEGANSPPQGSTPPPSDSDYLTSNLVQSLPSPDHPLSPTLPNIADNEGAEELVVNVGDLFPTAGRGVEWGCCLTVGDVDNIRQFIGSFVRGALVPYVERQVRHLTEVVTNRSRSKSLLSATRRWLGGSKNPNASTGTNVLYSSEASELQTRRLADLAFMFRMYDIAYNNYHTAKNDFKNDQAWLYFAGAQEMAALSLFLQNGSEFPKRYLETTWETLSTACKATNLGIRLLLVACEVLKHNRQYSEAAMYYIKLTSEDSDLLSALMLEQAASCFLKSGLVNKPGHRRKFAFHMTLAGHRYSKAGQKLLSLRANVLASKVYGVNGLVLAEDHILYSVGKFSTQLKSYGPALAAYTQLIDARSRLNAPSKQSVNQQLAYLREFLSLYRLVESNRDGNQLSRPESVSVSADEPLKNNSLPELPDLPVPWLCAQESTLLMDSSVPFNLAQNDPAVSHASGITFANYNREHSHKWAGLERITLEKTQGMMFRPPPPQFLNEHTDNTRTPLLSLNEPCWLQLPVRNPLLVSFAIRDTKLLYKFLPDDQDSSGFDSKLSVVQSSSEENIVLGPGESRNLVFQITSSQLGRIVIEGLEYKLSLTSENTYSDDNSSSLTAITGKQCFSVKGPRLNNTLKNRSSVLYASDHRLEISVVSPLPKVRVQFRGLPERLMCGQLTRADISLENIGSLPITGLYIASSDPQHSFSVFRKSHEQPAHDSSDKTASSESSIARKQIKDSFTCSRVQEINLNDASPPELPVNGVVKGTLWIRGQMSPGTQDLMLLFYCHSPNADAKVKYRFLRHHSSFAVETSMAVAVQSSSSVSIPLVLSSPVPSSSAAAQVPLETRPPASECSSWVEVYHSDVGNLANISVEVTNAAITEPDDVRRKLQVTAITCHSSKWKLKSFGNRSLCEDFSLLPGESVRTMVQSYSSSDSSMLSMEANNLFSVIPFSADPQDQTTVSWLPDDEWLEVSGSFALRHLVELPPLTAEPPPVCPNADCAAAVLHPALEQYNSLRRSSDLHLVLTVHWAQHHDSSSVVRGQHSVVLTSIGCEASVPEKGAPVVDPFSSLPLALAEEEPLPPVQIIPAAPIELPQIPSDFAKSVGIDLNANAGSFLKLPSTGLTVRQATSLYVKGEVDVTADLTAEQLDACVKVRALCAPCVTHDFSTKKLSPVNFTVLVHNTTDIDLACVFKLFHQTDASNLVGGTQDPPRATSASGTLRYVGTVTRKLKLPPSSQCRVPCQAVVVSAGAHSLGAVLLQLKTNDGIKLVKRVELDATVVVTDGR
ncbi:trafficking protein particle complex subunit 8 isoform X2 [Hyalella azteca]|uniref:Trafficking protein particle complex subunit 8 isoform X2 n=1 Tax=Hyalella azteca TaxID=294128 RepID=A0A8B7NSY3_HYAAZ|nr:trafficking protein particle complex subunit 8 isoform X2 [Hyalella azteca]